MENLFIVRFEDDDQLKYTNINYLFKKKKKTSSIGISVIIYFVYLY